MNVRAWQQARAVFEVAIELPAAEREACLDSSCGHDQSLRSLVEQLLADAEDTEDSWIDHGVSEGLVQTALSTASLQGKRIGDYMIRGVVGTGGMATVFEAEQQHPKRSVALKVMGFGFHSDEARRRFEYESEVLGRLAHPGIAQVFASGTYRDELTNLDVPYFAMELVAGADR